MSRTRQLATIARLRIELNTALRERASAVAERDGARLVVAAQAEQIGANERHIAYLADERDQIDAAHRAALADLAEAHRNLDEYDGVPAYDGDASMAALSDPASH